MRTGQRRVFWVGDTREALSEAPDAIRKAFGQALFEAQLGGKSDLAKPMHGDLRDVIEVVDSDDSGTFRLMYTVKIGGAVYALDFFQKKSRAGSKTPKADLDRLRERLKRAKEHATAQISKKY